MKTTANLFANVKLVSGLEVTEEKTYEYDSHARAYRDKFLQRVHQLGALGDVTIWFGDEPEQRVAELDDEYEAILG